MLHVSENFDLKFWGFNLKYFVGSTVCWPVEIIINVLGLFSALSALNELKQYMNYLCYTKMMP
jgi:hypothetical protein